MKSEGKLPDRQGTAVIVVVGCLILRPGCRGEFTKPRAHLSDYPSTNIQIAAPAKFSAAPFVFDLSEASIQYLQFWLERLPLFDILSN